MNVPRFLTLQATGDGPFVVTAGSAGARTPSAPWRTATSGRDDPIPPLVTIDTPSAPIGVGAAIGAGIGALAGSMTDVGISDSFINSVKQRVTPGTSALFVLSSDAVMDRIKDAFKDINAELIASNLTADQEAKLREVFADE